MVFKSLIPAILLVAVVAVVLFLLGKSETRYMKVNIGNVDVKAEIADTPLKQAKGLMFRKHLPENGGMFFTFDKENYHGFWMMNTSIALDIIWINKDMEIVHIERNAQPCFLSCPVYRPLEKVKYVLEVNGGFVDKHNVEVGHFVEF